MDSCLNAWRLADYPAPQDCPPPRFAKVTLVCMPFQVTGLSSLSIALLATLLRQRGIAVEELYLHFAFAELVGRDLYREMADSGSASQVGELLFASAYHGSTPAAALAAQLEARFGDHERRRQILDTFLDICRERLAAAAGELIGFTTSFHQLAPSLWLAREIKARWPARRIVFGGSACSDPMGRQLLAAYPEVDDVVSGYGEKPLLDLVYGRGSLPAAERRLTVNEERVFLDDLPTPDYAPFLAQARPFVANPGDLMLAFETSRGCWWGQKSHCTFCGLNQLELIYNQKSSQRAGDEILELWERYATDLFATDTILARSHLKDVLPRLARRSSKPRIFYEVKANMRSAEVELLKEAGVVWVQPGIESLSSPLLKHLRKGVSAIQNLAFLKWCREQRVKVSWNLLCAIPGERLEDYEHQLRLMEKVPHLVPPQGVSPIRVDRYSPYYNAFREFGWSGLEPLPIYRALHPQLGAEELMEISYHFSGQGGALEPETYFGRLRSAVDDWQRRHRQGDGLFWHEVIGLVQIEGKDTRLISGEGAVATVVAASHEVVGLDRLLALPGVDQPLIDRLEAQGILHREGRKVLNLAVRLPAESGALPAAA